LLASASSSGPFYLCPATCFPNLQICMVSSATIEAAFCCFLAD
jgi:hypothetical protein